MIYNNQQQKDTDMLLNLYGLLSPPTHRCSRTMTVITVDRNSPIQFRKAVWNWRQHKKGSRASNQVMNLKG